MLVLNYHNITSRKYGYDNRYELTQEQFYLHFEFFKNYYRKFPQKNDILANNLFLTFDDGYISHHDFVLPLLNENGIKAIFFPRTEMLDKKGFLSSEQLIKIHQSGHFIGNHFHGHMDCSRIEELAVIKSYEKAKKILQKTLTVNHIKMVAPPYGKVTKGMLSLISKENIILFTTNRIKNKTFNSSIVHRINVDTNLSITQIKRLLDENFFEWSRQKLRMKVKNLMIKSLYNL